MWLGPCFVLVVVTDAYQSSIISKQKINLHWYFRLTVKKAPFVIIYLDTYFPENI